MLSQAASHTCCSGLALAGAGSVAHQNGVRQAPAVAAHASTGPKKQASASVPASSLLCPQASSWLGDASRLATPSVRCSSGNGVISAEASTEEKFEITLEKPIGMNFYRGADGGTYVDMIQAGGNAQKSGRFQEGDKILETSAVFGPEMWPAAEFGRTMYTIRTRVGNVAFKVQKMNGKKVEEVPPEKYTEERKGGVVSEGIREMQYKNYLKKVEEKQQRAEKVEEGLKLYRAGKFEEALNAFESVLVLKPSPQEASVASYNLACCYSKLNQVEAGLDALDKAMDSGFEDYKTVRSDPDLDNLRKSERFTTLVNKYDEPFINENAVKALKSVFGFLGGNK